MQAMTFSWTCTYYALCLHLTLIMRAYTLPSSDPYSPNHRKYMSAEEVKNFFAPAKESVSAVRSWLENAGIDSGRVTQSANKQWLQFDGKAEEVERLLQTEYYIHTHATSGRTHLSCEK